MIWVELCFMDGAFFFWTNENLKLRRKQGTSINRNKSVFFFESWIIFYRQRRVIKSRVCNVDRKIDLGTEFYVSLELLF